tara:strand:- start:470 stop:658 length:189 start_codon:yes stop_codon:yes gene_type:complete
MAKKVETPQTEETLPQLDANDINILYTLVQQSNIKVSDVPMVAPTLDKCLAILNSVNKKVNG